MVTNWVIQSNLLDPVQISQIVDILIQEQIPYVGVQILPFVDEIKYLTDPPVGQKVIPYGSTKLARLAQQHNWSGMFFDLSRFRVDRWLVERDDMLNNNPIVVTVDQLRGIFDQIPDDEPWFIRPVEDLKAFNGIVTSAKEIRNWMSSVDSGNFSFDKETLVVVAPPQNILAEWRWFIVGGKVVSGSIYKMRGQRLVQRETDQKVIDEAQDFANRWLPHETCVMDIALTSSGPRVIEFNCFNSAGFYYHDIGAVVRAVTQYVTDAGQAH